ncbi:MAG: alpha/beta fold hydrolase [Herpetosiphon sp.]
MLLLHGFTSHDRSLAKLEQVAVSMGCATETPMLSGHGLTYRDLYGKRWHHWRADVWDAYARLRQRADRVVVIGYSMGGLLALELAAHPDVQIAGIAALAPALYIAHPLAPIAWMALGWYRFLPMGKSVAYSDPVMATGDDSYGKLATDAFVSFYRASRRLRRVLPQIGAPLLLIHSVRDRVIKPMSSQVIYDRVASDTKYLLWLKRSGHAMLDDVEASAVVGHVQRFLETLMPAQSGIVGTSS